MPRRLVLCLDGTWNTQSSFTNVWRINVALSRTAEQEVYYDQGVGTRAFEGISGGALGKGLSATVLRAYLWLTEKYRDGDQIFVFGFSRGSYTARSLVGFLSVCGILRPDAPINIDQAFSYYRKPGVTRESEGAVEFRERNSLEFEHGRPPCVELLGVFDTVGALGIPYAQIPLFEDYRWHKVHLSEIVRHAYHALAIDEHRELFDAALWRNRYPHQTVEQRWFVGAHANVGGGYLEDRLSIRPLEWMQQRSKALGLQFDYDPCRIRDRSAFLSEPVKDSWAEFLSGGYAKVRNVKNAFTSPRFYRTIGSREFWEPGREDFAMPRRFDTLHKAGERIRLGLERRGWVDPAKRPDPAVGEVLDGSVDERVRRNRLYRPPNLKPFYDQATWGS
ncbi:DUF2235 domain-containing protein [Variovorax sp. J22P168]|uniref:DUF2235 domain-containing protein n=1 Tax=Variovorax jilinensis TaxID=3053513 RepID=UPI002578B45C|nr:DUF2235 domain-containing protein [Variovorax sp. J22P168]MDM0014782.1 DUF2235 domain-containing protein [Variovorax sp. J22P168]